MAWFGLGKKRSRLGKWLDEHGITQEELAKDSGVSVSTISNLCDGNKKLFPIKRNTDRILKVLRKYDPTVRHENYWN